jgi:hypothetical protein
LRDGGALLTIRQSLHMSFGDAPSYLTSLGRRLMGAVAGVGPRSLADMTSMTGDTISAFVSSALGIDTRPSLDEILASHPDIRSESRIGRTSTVPGSSPKAVLEVPAPTGSFHVGTRPIALTDRTRSEPEAPNMPRSLVIQMWYPAAAGRFLRGKQEPLLTRSPGPFTGVRLTVGQ